MANPRPVLLGVAAVAACALGAWAAAARARADVERARLGALQAQMNPRFLFNTLNTVAALAGPSSARGEFVVEHLSAVLRRSL
jgi:LytS/YehU family sensor histidine kinase